MENSKVPIITAGSLHPAYGQLYETKMGDCVYLYSGYVFHNAPFHLLKPPLSLATRVTASTTPLSILLVCLHSAS
jgi:hypothetical protein